MDERKFSNAVILEKAALPSDCRRPPCLPRTGLSAQSPWTSIPAIFILSLAVAIGAVFLIDFLDTTLKDEADIEAQTGLPVLATIEYYGIQYSKG
jgi:capsular polysaccharide biosynthesis protein